MGSIADHQEDYKAKPNETWQEYRDRDIDRPKHYTYTSIECIDAMIKLYGVEKAIAYCELAAFKYRFRAGYKDDVQKDIAKALWYEKKAKELIQAKEWYPPEVIGNAGTRA